jgi:hypothetical protein
MIGVDAVEIPIWVTAKALSEASGKDIEEALLGAMEESLGGVLKLSPNLREWLKIAIGSSLALIVVDALDELTENDRGHFEAKAKQLDGLKGKVMVTCRTMHWEERKEWLRWRRITEMELSPFKRREQREFVRKFFKGDRRLAQGMERLLRVNFSLRHACTNPLLFTFACLLHCEGEVKDDTTMAGLYGHMVRKVFSGGWRGVRASWVGSTVKEERYLWFLEGIAWGLFYNAPHLNKFTLGDWEEAGRKALYEGREYPIDPSGFLEELEKVGFIVPAGVDERGDRCWSFVHRTFLEFLSARALSRMKQRVWLSEAKKHFWFQPEWLQVLTFLSGLVGDATPLIEAVEEEQDDLFRSMLHLKARLVGSAKNVDEGTVRKVCSEVYSFWYETLRGWRDCLREFALSNFTALASNATARGILIEQLLKMTWDKDVCLAAAFALGEIGSEEAVQRLLDLTWDEDEDVRWAAVRALGEIGSEEAVQRLLKMTRDEDKDVRETAIWALEEIGSEVAVPRLLEMTWDEDVSWAAVRALGEIGSEVAVPRLLKMIRDEHRFVREAAAFALGEIGSEEAVQRLLDLTWD